jgi:CheY-like chemotaxis protein
MYDIKTSANGADALDAAASERPDLIILDLGLPDIDGVEVIRKLRSWTPVPIVVLSGAAAPLRDGAGNGLPLPAVAPRGQRQNAARERFNSLNSGTAESSRTAS